MKRLVTLLLTGVMLTATACASSAPAPDPKPAAGTCSVAEPPAEDSVGKGAWIVLSKDKAVPGQRLSFEIRTTDQSEVVRGIGSTLECWSGTQWVATHTLVSGTNPTAHPISENVAIIEIALLGPGPENIVLPDGLSTGSYRIRKDVTLSVNGQSQNLVAYGRLQVTK